MERQENQTIDLELETVCKGFSSGTSESGLLRDGLSRLGKPCEHQTDHSEEDPGLLTTGKNLIVFGEPTPSGEPCKSCL